MHGTQQDIQVTLQKGSEDYVNVYIRNSQKKANIISIKKNIHVQQLRIIVARKINLPRQNLLLFLKGQKLEDGQHIAVGQKNIIHIINLENVRKQTINITIKPIHENHEPKSFKVHSKSNIKKFIDQQLFQVFKKDSHHLFLVCAGRSLKNQHTFQEYYVEDQSQLFCVSYQHPRNYNNKITHTVITHTQMKQQANDPHEKLLSPGRPSTNVFSKKQKQQKQTQAAPVNIIMQQNNPIQVIQAINPIKEKAESKQEKNQKEIKLNSENNTIEAKEALLIKQDHLKFNDNSKKNGQVQQSEEEDDNVNIQQFNVGQLANNTNLNDHNSNKETSLFDKIKQKIIKSFGNQIQTTK